jgi:hypothetical protein
VLLLRTDKHCVLLKSKYFRDASFQKASTVGKKRISDKITYTGVEILFIFLMLVSADWDDKSVLLCKKSNMFQTKNCTAL